MRNIVGEDAIAEWVSRGEKVSLERALALFETVYMPSRNLSGRTRAEYKTDLTQLVAFLQARGISTIEETGLSHLQAFLAHLDARGLTGVTRRRKTASIKALFGFLTAAGLMGHNPARGLIPPEREYKEPRFLSTQEYRALLRACAHETRDAAIIELILQTGMRLSEVARLSIHDVELPSRINRDPANTGSISVQGKGRKQRSLPLNYKACRALKAWLTIRPDIPDSALFVTKFRERMGPRAIQRAVEKYLKEAGIKNASVHSLRHTFATHHVARGTDLRTVQEALGHADLKSTSIYVSTAKAAMKRDLQEHAL
ncbi:MAG: tyrosine recombinase XerC [Anaerolineae bacterium]